MQNYSRGVLYFDGQLRAPAHIQKSPLIILKFIILNYYYLCLLTTNK